MTKKKEEPPIETNQISPFITLVLSEQRQMLADGLLWVNAPLNVNVLNKG